MNRCGRFIRNECGRFIVNGDGSFIVNGDGRFIVNGQSRFIRNRQNWRNRVLRGLGVPPILLDVEVGGELGRPLLRGRGVAMQRIGRQGLGNGVGEGMGEKRRRRRENERGAQNGVFEGKGTLGEWREKWKLQFALDEREGFGVLDGFRGESGSLEMIMEGNVYGGEIVCGRVVVDVEGLQDLAGLVVVAEQDGGHFVHLPRDSDGMIESTQQEGLITSD